MILDCRNISYRYPTAETPVFEQLSFHIETPGFHALFGSSGVGKTSLAKIISRDITDYTGEVTAETTPAVLYTYNLERLPDWSQVGKHLTKITPSGKSARLKRLIDLFGLNEHLSARFSQLSLGQKNRANLIRYLVQEFRILIMDESLANVDEKTREIIILAIKDQFPERCFLYISHNVTEIAKCCRHIFILRPHGKLPRIVRVTGQNHFPGDTVDHDRLSHTMLEVMNAV